MYNSFPGLRHFTLFVVHVFGDQFAPVFLCLVSIETSVAFHTDDVADQIENDAQLTILLSTAFASHIANRQMVICVSAVLHSLQVALDQGNPVLRVV